MERISESGLGRLLHYNMTCIGGFMGTFASSAGLEGILPRPYGKHHESYKGSGGVRSHTGRNPAGGSGLIQSFHCGSLSDKPYGKA